MIAEVGWSLSLNPVLSVIIVIFHLSTDSTEGDICRYERNDYLKAFSMLTPV